MNEAAVEARAVVHPSYILPVGDAGPLFSPGDAMSSPSPSLSTYSVSFHVAVSTLFHGPLCNTDFTLQFKNIKYSIFIRCTVYLFNKLFT